MAVTEEALGARIARLGRLGRARGFSPANFERALTAMRRMVPRPELLRLLLLEWSGVGLSETEAVEVWARVGEAHQQLRACLGGPVSLQTALLHELHTRRGLIREPRILPESDVSALRVNAITDPLTGLYNRRFLHDHLGREIARAERSGGVVSVILMDLQRFKAINDRLGHPVGDGVLVRTAALIRESLRTIDAGCRYGGDEFVAVLPNTALLNSLFVAERIRKRVSSLRLPKQMGLQMGLHYGMASYPTDGRTAEFLIKMSDRRLYDCRQYDSNPRGRRHPRFEVDGVSLRLARPADPRQVMVDVRDIGYGGLSFVYPGSDLPPRIEGEIVQKHTSDSQKVTMRAVNVSPLRGGAARVGCAYVH